MAVSRLLHNRVKLIATCCGMNESRLVRRRELSVERNRRKWAEAIYLRTQAGGIRPDSEFPSVRDVVQDVQYLLIQDVLTWTEKACGLHGSNPALPATIRDVLVHTFTACREEVKRCLDMRLQGLSGFMGKDEAISLSPGGDTMSLATQYVLYECLRKNHRNIVSTEPDITSRLAASILQRCRRSEKLAEAIVRGDAWPSFETLVQHYTKVFVEASTIEELVFPGGLVDESDLT